MNTKNIFRTLFMAVLLLVGANGAKAVDLWTGTAVGGQCYAGYGGNDGAVDISESTFANLDLSAGTKLRVYATLNNNDGSEGRWKFFIMNSSWRSHQFENWCGDSNCNLYDYHSPSNYNAAEGYFEFVLSSNSAAYFKNENYVGGGATIRFLGLTVTRVELVTGGGGNAGPQTYTLTINVDGETTTKSVAVGTDLASLLPTPTKAGYIFTGWSGLPADGKMPASDLTVTAQFKEREHVTATIASTTGFATFCSDKALDFSNVSGLKAYYATAINDDEVVFRQVRGTVAANTGLLISGETSKIYVADGTGTSYNGNLLKGVLTNTSVNSANQYVLVERNGEAKFADTAGNAATVPAGKAYLEAPSSSSRILSFSFDDGTTGISAVVTAEQQNTAVYNLQGQRVTTVGKGLYIVNGKKVMIK